ncbi:MAG: DUF6132 family protein [Tannerella sp.]|jgi:xanthine/uracil permease|nr:DUF6132 family protein [Tannerella sp.]
MKKVMAIIKKKALILIGIVVGAVGGYLYWRYVGCSSSNCPITSSPLWSSVWGAISGGLFFDMFKKKEK